MNREDIIRMARKAGFDYSGAELTWESVICTEELERFAALVRADEREACAKVCEENADDHSEGDWDSACISCENSIRLRDKHDTK